VPDKNAPGTRFILPETPVLVCGPDPAQWTRTKKAAAGPGGKKPAAALSENSELAKFRTGGKIRNPKHETNSKPETQMT
jgi:hypothetical protein